MKSLFNPIAIGLVCCASATVARAAEEPDNRRTNAALYYWQAAALLPDMNDAQAEQLRDVADAKIEFQPDLLEALDFASTERFLHKAAACAANCDWGLAWEDGPEMIVPHLPKLRELSSVALVLAEAAFSRGDTAAGIDLLLVAHRIARDAGAGDYLIGHVVQNVLERKAIGIASRHCLGWSAAERGGYLTRLDTLPGLHPLHGAFAREILWTDWFEQQVADNLAAADKLLGASADGKDGVTTKSPEFIAEMIAEQRRIHGEAHAALMLQGEARRAAVSKIQATFEGSKNLLVSLVMPDLISLSRSEDQASISLAMLKAALAHGAEIGEQDLQGKPFKLVRMDGGLELVSETPACSVRLGK